MYMEQTASFALNFMHPKIYTMSGLHQSLTETLPIPHFFFFFFLYSILLKSKPRYAAVVEYYILPARIWMLLRATCAGWSRPCVRAVALRAEEGKQ